MSEDLRLDGKLAELSRELMVRSPVSGFAIAEAFASRRNKAHFHSGEQVGLENFWAISSVSHA